MKSGKVHSLFIFIGLAAALANATFQGRHGWAGFGMMFCVAPQVVGVYVVCAIPIVKSKKSFTYYRWCYAYVILSLISSFFIVTDDGFDGKYFLGKNYSKSDLPSYANFIGSTAWILFSLGILWVYIMFFAQLYKNHKSH
ncbi:MAG TPA: hypothetical protein PKB15_06145 [Acidimicrobiia bacterium]|nr:hypothetical protein [Acidimicrobiia bacterium]